MHISQNPRLRSSLAQKWKPFAILSFMFLLVAGFQNFIEVKNEGDAALDRPHGKVFRISGVVTGAKIFETTDGPFNVITGKGDKPFRVEYLGALDVSGKACMALAEKASRSQQRFQVSGILALPGARETDRSVVFQKVLDCQVRPAKATEPISKPQPAQFLSSASSGHAT